jgi:hypothetical protein
VKQIPSDPTQVFEIAELFFGDSFFDMLCQETNRYYLQNREKYDRSYKVHVVTESTSGTSLQLQLKVELSLLLTNNELCHIGVWGRIGE